MLIFLAAHSRPNIEIWQSLLLFSHFWCFKTSNIIRFVDFQFLFSNKFFFKKKDGAGSLAGKSDPTTFLLCTISGGGVGGG